MIQDSLTLLHQFQYAKDVEIRELLDTDGIQVLSAKASLKDGSAIFVRERFSSDKIRYSYHWQDSKGKLLLRFDNAPHHSRIATAPHHQHEGERVKPLTDPTLQHFLDKVSKKLQ